MALRGEQGRVQRADAIILGYGYYRLVDPYDNPWFNRNDVNNALADNPVAHEIPHGSMKASLGRLAKNKYIDYRLAGGHPPGIKRVGPPPKRARITDQGIEALCEHLVHNITYQRPFITLKEALVLPQSIAIVLREGVFDRCLRETIAGNVPPNLLERVD